MLMDMWAFMGMKWQTNWQEMAVWDIKGKVNGQWTMIKIQRAFYKFYSRLFDFYISCKLSYRKK